MALWKSPGLGWLNPSITLTLSSKTDLFRTSLNYRVLRGLLVCLALAGLMVAGSNDAWAKASRGKRAKRQAGQGHTFAIEADESVAQQINDPTSFLREIRLDTSIEHGSGSKHTLVEWTPALALPLSQRLRFETGVPMLSNGPRDRDEVELGDIYASCAYIFLESARFNALADFRIDLPTGNESREAGLNVTQWHAALGSVVYAFEEQGVLIIPFVEYRRSIFETPGSPRVSSLIGSVGVVYLLSEQSYLRGDWTLHFDGHNGWQDSALLNIEIGRVFADRYSLSLGYEFDVWGDAELRNAATVSMGYLF